MSTAKEIEDPETLPKRNNLWLGMSILFGLLPSAYVFLEDGMNDIGSLGQIPKAIVSAGWYVSPVTAIVFCIIGIIKASNGWKLIPVLLLLLNLGVFLFVYALYQWANSCGGGAYQC